MKRVIFFLLLFSALIVKADPEEINLKLGELTLKGYLHNPLPSNDQGRTIFLLVHGSWAHADMEIIDGLQGLLAEFNYPSLAINLSLGIDNRTGYLDCKDAGGANYTLALSEINHWIVHLEENGWQQIAILGHSRGGNQVALTQTSNFDSVIAKVLIAPSVWNAENTRERYLNQTGKKLDHLLERAQKNPDDIMPSTWVFRCPEVDISGKNFLSYYSEEPNKNTPELLEDASLPTLVYLGTDDPLTEGFMEQSRLFEQNEQVSVKIIDGADHFFLDFFLDELVEDMLIQLEKISP